MESSFLVCPAPKGVTYVRPQALGPLVRGNILGFISCRSNINSCDFKMGPGFWGRLEFRGSLLAPSAPLSFPILLFEQSSRGFFHFFESTTYVFCIFLYIWVPGRLLVVHRKNDSRKYVKKNP